MDWHIAVALLASGALVGIINTLAGGGSIITMTMFMAFGLPIIASSVGAIPDMLPESQQDCLLTPGDVEKLSKLLADLAGNNIRLQQISSELQQRFAGKFSAAEVFKQQKMIYETLLSGSSN